MKNVKAINSDPWIRWSKSIEDLARRHPLRVLFWQTTLNCDSSCEYCSSPREWWKHSDELSTEEIINALRSIARDFNLDHVNQLSFTGGEPLLRDDLPLVATEAKKLGFGNLALQTNGRIGSRKPRLVDELINAGVRIWGVNLDGPREVHNDLRCKGEWFDDAYSFAQYLCNDKRLTATITTVVSQKNIDLIEDTYQMVSKLHPATWRIAQFDAIGRGADVESEYKLRSTDLCRLLVFLREIRAGNLNSPGAFEVEFACGGWLGKNWEGIVRPYIFHCVSGIDTMTILYDGGITGCPVVSRSLIQGNVRNDNIREVWNTRFGIFRDFKAHSSPQCLKCPDWKFCHGGPMHIMQREEKHHSGQYCLRLS